MNAATFASLLPSPVRLSSLNVDVSRCRTRNRSAAPTAVDVFPAMSRHMFDTLRDSICVPYWKPSGTAELSSIAETSLSLSVRSTVGPATDGEVGRLDWMKIPCVSVCLIVFPVTESEIEPAPSRSNEIPFASLEPESAFASPMVLFAAMPWTDDEAVAVSSTIICSALPACRRNVEPVTLNVRPALSSTLKFTPLSESVNCVPPLTVTFPEAVPENAGRSESPRLPVKLPPLMPSVDADVPLPSSRNPLPPVRTLFGPNVEPDTCSVALPLVGVQ